MKFKELKVGEVLSESQYYKVKKIVDNKVQLETDRGENIVVDDKYVESCLLSADSYSSEKEMNKTDLAALFLKSTNVAISVNFNKQLKEKDLIDTIIANKTKPDKELKKLIQDNLVGEERTMKGRHYGNTDDLGRVAFIDMEIDKVAGSAHDVRLRQVDPRSINWLIVGDVKYKLK